MKIKALSLLLLLLLLTVACSPAAASAALEPAALSTPLPEEATPEVVEATAVPAESPELPPAEIVNDEGGPVNITGEVEYTNAFFTLGVAEPVVILEDQAGFVDRNENFLMPIASQTLGQITSDFFTSPFSYSIALPIEPQGTLRDVDNDGVAETGVQVFAPAYWTNTFGDPYLEERDLFGGGWSTAYASTRTSSDAETRREIVGGKLLIYAPEEGQGFPSGFGEDGLLFTADDPLVTVPQGYTVVDLDSAPFTFDRARDQIIDLIEPESSALVDYSDLSYTEAFEALVDKLSKEYAFTEYKGLDWEQIREDLRPQFEAADEAQDVQLYRSGLRDLAQSIPDGHVSGPQLLDEFLAETSGGLGIAMRELDDGRALVTFLTPDSPAAEEGIELGAEIVTINGEPVADAISAAVPHSGPFSTEHFKRLQQMRYATRFPLETEVEISYVNPESDEEVTATLTAVAEPESFASSSFNIGRDGFELPVEYRLLPESPYAYAAITSFSDNELLTIQLWERLMRTLNEQGVPGLIIDMRQNSGGSGFLADQMAAYFYQEPHVIGNTGRYDEDLDEFYFDPRSEQRFYLPAEELRYDGQVAVLVGPNCNSACEFFSYDMTIDDRADIVGQYPTAGLGGSIDTVKMPGGEFFTFTKGRAVDADGNIHIEGKGVPPTVLVPVNEETLFSSGDPVLEAAQADLDKALLPDITDAGAIVIGDTAQGELDAGARVQYVLNVTEGEILNIVVSSDLFDPGLLILDEGGNILLANDNISDDVTDAGFEGLEIPSDGVLLLQVVALDEEAGGPFTLQISANEN
jgi:C-terminal processing protease CtpA/Prc